MSNDSIDLARLFEAVRATINRNREALDQADTKNGNHGEHMLEIFKIATQAAKERQGDNLAEAMEYASWLLLQYPENGSALLYGRGLAELAIQFRKRNINLDELVLYVRGVLEEKKDAEPSLPQGRAGEILKALLAGLSGWQQAETGQAQPANRLEIGYLFELGMAYMQAKQRGGSRAEILADAAASASPLNGVPHRYLSGKMSIQAFLEAMRGEM